MPMCPMPHCHCSNTGILQFLHLRIPNQHTSKVSCVLFSTNKKEHEQNMDEYRKTEELKNAADEHDEGAVQIIAVL